MAGPAGPTGANTALKNRLQTDAGRRGLWLRWDEGHVALPGEQTRHRTVGVWTAPHTCATSGTKVTPDSGGRRAFGNEAEWIGYPHGKTILLRTVRKSAMEGLQRLI